MNSTVSALFRAIPPYSALFRDPVENKITIPPAYAGTVCRTWEVHRRSEIPRPLRSLRYLLFKTTQFRCPHLRLPSKARRATEGSFAVTIPLS